MNSFKMTNFFKAVGALLIAMTLAAGLPALALELGPLKADGVIGERADGYLGIVDPSASASVRSYVEEVNAKRREQYQRIAEKNNITLAEVEILAGQKTLEKTEPGGWIFDTEWHRK